MKKLGRILGSLLVVLTLLCASLTAFAAEDVESKYGITEAEVLEATLSYYEQVSVLSDEELETTITNYASDPIASEYFGSWKDVKGNLGAFIQVLEDKLTITMTDDGFKAVLPIKYENDTVHLTMAFNELEGVNSITFEVYEEMTLGTIFQKAALNTILGMGTVFAVLILISFIIYLLGVICGGGQAKAEKAPKAEKAVKPAEKEANVEEEMVVAIAAASAAAQSDDTELVAVISAAIAAATGTSTDGFVVRSIRKVKRG